MRATALSVCLLSFGLVNNATAHCVHNKFYGGAGVGFNSVEGFNDAAGFQLFGGYCLNFHFNDSNARTQLEVGYWDSGELEQDVNTTTTSTTRRGGGDDDGGRTTTQTTTRTGVDTKSLTGVWVSGIGEYKFSKLTHLLGRIGIDLGDDSGIVAGLGMGLNFSKWAQFRGEYIVRDESESVQISWLSEFK